MQQALIWLVRTGIKIMQVVGPAMKVALVVMSAIDDLAKVIRRGRYGGMA